jgi:hypothetical protein
MLQKIKDFLTKIFNWIFSIEIVEDMPDFTYRNKPSVISSNNSEGFEPKVVSESPVRRRDRREFTEEQIKRIIQVRKANDSYIRHRVLSVDDLAFKLNIEFQLNKSLRSYQKVWKDWRNVEE